jgi:hypothetical protein
MARNFKGLLNLPGQLLKDPLRALKNTTRRPLKKITAQKLQWVLAGKVYSNPAASNRNS